MKKKFIQSILILILILCPVLSYAAFDGTRPRDNDLLKDSAALIRTNFNALKDMIDQIYVNYAGTDAVALKADKTYVDLNFSTTKEVELILFNLDTVAARLDSIENNILDMIQPAIDMLFANIGTLENLVISNYNELIANMQTHEAELAAITGEITELKVNDITQEVRLVRAIAAYENRYKKMILCYGYPIAINDLWDINKAAAIYAMYDIVVFGDEYEKATHEAHSSTINIITRLKKLKTDVEIFGYIPIGGELGANLDTDEILLRIDEWLASGATGIFLDEYGYDYLVSRERQNIAVDYAHSKGMNIIANSWNIDWVFNNDSGYLDWEEFYGNPNLVAPKINANDYYLFENLFYYYEDSSQKVSDQWRLYEVYRYYYDSATSTWGKNYYDQFGTKTLGLDGIQSNNSNRDLYFINGYVGGRILNLDGYGASIELWGSSSTAYNHYNPSFFANEATVFNRDKIQPIVGDYSKATYAQYDTKINGITLKLIWEPGSPATNPAKGTHKVQISGIDRTKSYVSSSATSDNASNTIVLRDTSGNFSAGTITATLAGNASTATTLQTARTIAGSSFNGSDDINISHLNLTDIGVRTHADIDAAFGTIEIKLDSISVAINSIFQAVLDAIDALVAEDISVDSSGFTGTLKLSDNTVQKALTTLDALSGLPATNAITKIYGNADVGGSGTGSVWLVGTNGVSVNRTGNTLEVDIDSAAKWADYYTAAQTNATIEAAISAIPPTDLTNYYTAAQTDATVSTALLPYYTATQTDATIEAAISAIPPAPPSGEKIELSAIGVENLNAGEICKLINDGGMKAHKLTKVIMGPGSGPPTMSSSKNLTGSVIELISATRMTDTTAIIAFRDHGDSYKGRAVVATISGGTLSMSSPTYMISGGTDNSSISATRMTDTTAIIAFRDHGDSYKGKAVVATISGGTISMSSPTYMISGGTANSEISATRMTDTTAIIAFRDNGNSNKGRAVVATISGGTISSVSSPAYLISGGTANSEISATRMTDTTAIIAFRDEDNSNKGRAVVATISGGTISMSSPAYLISDGTANIYISATRMTDTTAIIAFRDSGNSDKGRAVVATISGGTLSMSSPAYLISGGTANSDTSATRMTDTTAIIAFRDAGDSGKGKAVVCEVPPSPQTPLYLPAMANTSVSQNASGTFTLLSPFNTITNAGLSLTANQYYFLNAANNTWTTTPSDYYVGYALSSTKIMIDGSYYNNMLNSHATLPVSLTRK